MPTTVWAMKEMLHWQENVSCEIAPASLNYLLSTRYCWMNEYLKSTDIVIEIGAGAGFSREFLDHKNLKLTDLQ
jgi:hypothetical protein